MAAPDAASRTAIVRPANQQRRLVARGGVVAITLLVTSADTNGRYFVADYVAQAQAPGPALHLHRDIEETFCVLDGTMQFAIGDDRLTAEVGTVIHVPRHVPHAFWNAGPAPCRMQITMSPGGFERYFEDLIALNNGDSAAGSDILLLISRLNQQYDQVVLGPNPFIVPPAK